MEQTTQQETVYFSSLHELYGGLRLANKYITKERLEYLFQSVGGRVVHGSHERWRTISHCISDLTKVRHALDAH